MIKLEDVKIDEYHISLSKLLGKEIRDISIYLGQEYDDISICPYRVIFSDGTQMGFEGEHDFPYLTEFRTQKQPNLDDETLEQLYKELNGEIDDELFE